MTSLTVVMALRIHNAQLIRDLKLLFSIYLLAANYQLIVEIPDNILAKIS
jgi:hypothetical protein